MRRRIDALGHDRAEHPAAGRRPHPGPGAGPAGPAASEGASRQHGEARIPPARRTGRGRCRHAALKDAGGQRVPVERRVIVEGGDLTDAQPAFDSAHQRADRQLPLQRARRAALRPGDDRERRPAARHRARQRGDLRAAHPFSRSPAAPARSPAASRCSRPTTLRCCCAPARLPAKLTIVEERTVGPGLGPGFHRGRQDGDLRGDRSSSSIFMFATYGLFGLFANIALLVHVGLIFGLMSMLEATLTLPGIAGIVLTIGTAVDSNVLIYERIREEAQAGRSMVSAIQAGFDRAFATIVDSNSTMAIAARDPVLPRLRPGARLRGRLHPRHPDDGPHRRDPDAHDDRALVSLDASESPSVLRSSSSCASSAFGPTTPISTSCASGALSFPFSAVLSVATIVVVPHDRAQFRHRLQGRHAHGAAGEVRHRPM